MRLVSLSPNITLSEEALKLYMLIFESRTKNKMLQSCTYTAFIFVIIMNSNYILFDADP